MSYVDHIVLLLSELRARQPLVHNITNYVVMNNTANALLAVGASPAMVHAPEEVSEFVRISQALVVNIGTLSTTWIEAMQKAVLEAEQSRCPWILDPVGAGATRFRTDAALRLLAMRPMVVRANASEVLALAGAMDHASRGVDSTHRSSDVVEVARRLAHTHRTVVAVSGATDYITDGSEVVEVDNGHPLMTRVTGLGCTATALIGAFLGAGAPALLAAVTGLTVIGLAGERAARGVEGPGALQVRILDELHRMDERTLRAEGRVR